MLWPGFPLFTLSSSCAGLVRFRSCVIYFFKWLFNAKLCVDRVVRGTFIIFCPSRPTEWNSWCEGKLCWHGSRSSKSFMSKFSHSSVSCLLYCYWRLEGPWDDFLSVRLDKLPPCAVFLPSVTFFRVKAYCFSSIHLALKCTWSAVCLPASAFRDLTFF